jgi:hypothetical protein
LLDNVDTTGCAGSLKAQPKLSTAAAHHVVGHHHPHVVSKVLDEEDILGVVSLKARVGRLGVGVVVRVEGRPAVDVALATAERIVTG